LEKFIREIIYFEDYYLDFYEEQKPAVKKKLNFTIGMIATVDKIPKKFFEHITGSTGLFEIRVEVGSDIFRVFSCFDKGKLIILLNGFQKKIQKTPKNEIELAEKLKKQYFDGKDDK
jgi:phage-related protein